MSLLGKSYLSIDIGKSSCKVVEAQLKPVLRIKSYGLYPLGKLKRNMFGAKEAVISFHDPSVIIRELHLPNTDERDLSFMIQNEVSEFLPEIYKDYNTSYRSVVDQENANLIYVVLAACPNAVARSYTDTIENTGIKVKLIDAQINSLTKLVELIIDGRGINRNDGYLLADIGYSNISISIIGQGRILIHKILGYGTGYLSGYGAGKDELIIKLSDELSRFIEFFMMSGYRIPLKQGFLCGGGTYLPSIAKELENSTGLVIDMLDSCKRFLPWLPADLDLNIYSNCLGALLRRDDAL